MTLVAASMMFPSCNDYLDTEPSNVFDNDVIFSDTEMIKSVLSGLYRRTAVYDRLLDYDDGQGGVYPDEMVPSGEETMSQIDRNLFWRHGDNNNNPIVWDYTFIRRCNMFLQGLTEAVESGAVTQAAADVYEGEVRALRAYQYFVSARGLGGVPNVGDNVYDFEAGLTPDQIATKYQVARSTEEATWDYVISELEAAANLLGEGTYNNAARMNKWAALGLRARAAVYAASIAKHTPQSQYATSLKTPGLEAGIPVESAHKFYQIALQSAEAVIKNSPYSLKEPASANPTAAERARAFYEATSVKGGNPEVIWALDRIRPNFQCGYTQMNVPFSHAEDLDAAKYGIQYNMVEEFEYIDGRGGRPATAGAVLGELPIGTDANPTQYDYSLDLFAGKDPRLAGTVILPGADYTQGTRMGPVMLWAGIYIPTETGNARWDSGTGGAGAVKDFKIKGVDVEVQVISDNGPVWQSSNQNVNKSGFFLRKFMDETRAASGRGTRSDMWNLRIRLAEMYMIAAEALVEDNTLTSTIGMTAMDHLNTLRKRAGISLLTAAPTFFDIVQEYRAEFSLEGHRYWDLRRWRIADVLWNGSANTRTSQTTVLFPYKVYNPNADVADWKWVFRKRNSDRFRNPRKFIPDGYYMSIQDSWRTNNPKIVQNPYQ